MKKDKLVNLEVYEYHKKVDAQHGGRVLALSWKGGEEC